jgi:hypothetical protein
MVVSYVANADNYKQKYNTANTQLSTARQEADQAKEDLESAKAQFKLTETNVKKGMSDAKAKQLKAENELSEAKRQITRLEEEESKYIKLHNEFKDTMEHQGKMLEKTQEELEKARTAGVKLQKELDETSNTLIEKLAVLDNLQKKIDSLEKEKAELLARVDEPLKPFGSETVTDKMLVDVKPGPATTVMPVMDIDVKALVKAVDMKNSMASVSVGSADGVTEGMRFHVTRGNAFICDIVIISVDVEESVGVLELVQQQPSAGDNASTNF